MFGSGAGGAAIRFYWDAWRSFTSAVTFLLGRFMFVYACCLPQRAKQDGLRDRAFLFRVGRDRHSCVLGSSCGYRTWLVHFGLVRFFMAIPTGNEETRERGERSRRRGVGASLRDHIGFVMLSAGSTLGLRAPDCAKESSTLWTLFI